MIADRRLYLTADKRVVEEGNPEAKSLLVGAGSELSEADANKYGLSFEGDKIVIGEVPTTEKDATETAQEPAAPAPAAETVEESGEKVMRMGEETGEADGKGEAGEDGDSTYESKSARKPKAPARHK